MLGAGKDLEGCLLIVHEYARRKRFLIITRGGNEGGVTG